MANKYCHILPVQLNPFPKYPSIQTQQKLPGVLKQSAFISQLPVFSAHSSTSADSEQESSAKLTNQRDSYAFTSSPLSFHACHILPT